MFAYLTFTKKIRGKIIYLYTRKMKLVLKNKIKISFILFWSISILFLAWRIIDRENK